MSFKIVRNDIVKMNTEAFADGSETVEVSELIASATEGESNIIA